MTRACERMPCSRSYLNASLIVEYVQPDRHSHLRLVLGGLNDLGCAHIKFRPKHPVPKAACDTEAILVVGKVVLEVVLLQLLVVLGKPSRS